MATVYPEGPLDDYFRDEGDDDSLLTATLAEANDHRRSDLPSSLEDELNGISTGFNNDMEFRRRSNESGHTTLVNSQSPFQGEVEVEVEADDRMEHKGWTGVRPNVPGPSTSPPIMNPQQHQHHQYALDSSTQRRLKEMVPGKFPSPTRLSFDQETFAEKFKYTICSSGLLEKDYVPALSGGLALGSEGEGEGEQQTAGRDHEAGYTGDDRVIGSDLGKEAQRWIEFARERWDLTLAGLCLLLGIVLSMGIWTLAALILILGGGGSAWYMGKTTPADNITPTLAKSPSFPQETAKTRALASLTTFISQSHNLNSTLSSSLTLLDPHPYNLNTHHTLRVTLHRLTGNMTDHLATATSTLLERTDRKELGVLGEMYDIPVVGSFFYSRRHRHPLSSSSEEDDYDNYEAEEEDLSDPRGLDRPSPMSIGGLSNSTRSPFGNGTIPRRGSRASVPFSATQTASSPLKRLHTHSHRTQHLSLMSQRDADDRFTQLPDRTPRLSRRSSADRLDSARSLRVERPRHERRITEADEEAEEEQDEADDGDGDISRSDRSGSDGDGDGDDRTKDIRPVKSAITPSPTSPILQDPARIVSIVPRTPILTKGTPRGSPSPFQHVPSPLSRRLSTASEGLQPLRTAALVTPSRSSGRSPSLLSSPLISGREASVPPSSAPLRAALSLDPESGGGSGGNPKRRSLQNMPYYHSSDDERGQPTSAGLTRTRSMPLSDLQALRTASSTGFRSRRSSLNPVYGLGMSPNLGPPSANASLAGLGYGSPLQLPSSSFPPDKRSSISTILSQHSTRPSLTLKRVESVSPLTAPALKAGCLGIHLKRRRLACCLLGLRFGESEEYWEEVRVALQVLIEGIAEERTALEAELKEAQKEAEAMAALNNSKPNINIFGSLSDAWSPADSVLSFNINGHGLGEGGGKDFAPRTSDEALLLSHFDTMGSALVNAWMELSSFREALKAEDVNSAVRGDGWAEIRSKLGDAVREWERGREILSRMKDEQDDHGDETVQDERDSRELPAFMRAWDDAGVEADGDGDTSQSTSLQTDRDHENENENEELNDPSRPIMINEGEHLPPVGKDTIFEAISLPPLSNEKDLLGKMSRAERITLAKEAREMGLSLSDMLKTRASASGGENQAGMGQATEKEMRMKGGLVVDELRGVISVIRRMKEGEGEGQHNPGYEGGHINRENSILQIPNVESRLTPESPLSPSTTDGPSRPVERKSREYSSGESHEIDNADSDRDNQRGTTDTESVSASSALVNKHSEDHGEEEDGPQSAKRVEKVSLAPPLPISFDIGELKRSFQFPGSRGDSGSGIGNGVEKYVLE
ncbi:hypothetical protein IAT40_008005 [Kwoniella sp. CBS 6097]